jgi:excinuclease ABC subunit C
MTLHEKIQCLPDAPGVYLFQDARGDLLYVGKAVSLRKRVQSYFTDREFGFDRERLSAMVAQVADLETLLTANELEALVLESNLIKERRPRYNIVLRDDKHYPFIRLDPRDPFPALKVVRRTRRDGAWYFGPYVPAGTMWDLLALLHRTFPLRTCRSLAGRTRCLEYHLGRCLAPCEGLVSPEEYAEIVARVRLILDGKDREVVQQLTKQMQEAAERLEFERAARLRDQVESLRRAGQGQRVLSTRGEEQDALGVAQEGDEVQVQLLQVRGGKLIGRHRFGFDGLGPTSEAMVLGSVIAQYYVGAREVPPVLLVSHPLPEADLLAHMLSTRASHAVALLVPARGPKARLIAMAVGNAQAVLTQSLASASARARALCELQEALALPRCPQRIECADISNLSGVLAVGSLVTFVDGRPSRGAYKRFRIRTVAGADDYAMLREVIGRRLAHRDWPAPDLLLIDGGRGQLNVGLLAAKEAGVADLPLASLAKEEELVFRPGMPQPIRLPEGSRAKHLLQQLRDEAHRFGLAYHRQLRGKSGLRSALDEIPGIGPRRKRQLLQRFGSLTRLREASAGELCTVGGLPPRVAEATQRFLAALAED